MSQPKRDEPELAEKAEAQPAQEDGPAYPDWMPTDDDLALLTDSEIDVVLSSLDAIRKDEPAWTPQPKQALASYLAGQATETLFGGAAGGGKSEWLLHYAAKQMVDHPFNYGAIFRRVFPSLVGTLIPRSKRIYPEMGATWNGQEHRWTFPNGSVLLMGSLQYSDTVLEHQGAEFGFIAFEEVTEFLESQYTYLIGRLRAPGPGIRPHVVSTANPGGRGHVWVKRRFVKPKEVDWQRSALQQKVRDLTLSSEVAAMPATEPVSFRVWTPTSTLDNPNPVGRVFVPATLADNPRLMARDPEYVNRLRANVDKALAKAMEHGDWDAIDAIEGALWNQSWFDGGRVPEGYARRVGVVERVVAVDPSDGNESGHGDEFGVCVAAKGQDGVGYVEYSNGWLMSPRKMAEATIALYHRFNCDAIIVERNHGGRWVKEVLLSVDRYANVKEVWASDGKITRARPVAALFEPDDSQKLPYRARLAGFFENFEEECTTFTGGPAETSPNQLDAGVWALSHLMLGDRIARASDYDDQRLTGRR